MAVKACVECGEMVSEDAKACPHCGKKDPTETIGDKIGGFIFTIIVVGGVAWWSPWSSNDKAEPKNYPISNATYSQVEYEVGCKGQYSDDKKEDIELERYY